MRQALEQAKAALEDVAQSLAWLSFGECRGWSTNLLTSNDALDKARAALASLSSALEREEPADDADALTIAYLHGFSEGKKAASPAASPQGDARWRPIETAPKDGDPVWLLTDGAVVRGVWCEQDFREYRDADGRYLDQQDDDAFWVNLEAGDTCEPTHWQPITKPAAAASQQQDAEGGKQ